MPETQQVIEERWKAVIARFLITGNGQDAYENCGYYKSKGKNAGIGFAGLLRKPRFQELLKEAIGKRNTRLELSADAAVLQVLRLANSDIRDTIQWPEIKLPVAPDAIDDDGNPNPKYITIKASADLTDDQAAAISEFDYNLTENGLRVKYKQHDKGAALDKLFKHMGLYSADRTLKVQMDDDISTAREIVSDALTRTGMRLQRLGAVDEKSVNGTTASESISND